MKVLALALTLAVLAPFSSLRTAKAGNRDDSPRAAKPGTHGHERAANFGTVYAGQWLVYGTTQRETIADHASWRNFRRNVLSPHFDRDNLEYNVIRHSLAGASYYLFYRSRGYTAENAFFWTVASSLAFEFAIESFTERPSYQDAVQTPAFGAALGMGLESVSRRLHSSGTWWGRLLGYFLNPFTLLPDSRYALAVAPVQTPERLGLAVTADF